MCLRGYGYRYSFCINTHMLVYLYANSCAWMHVFDGCIGINLYVVPCGTQYACTMTIDYGSVISEQGKRQQRIKSVLEPSDSVQRR